jgi:hypothetical protein
MPIPSLFQIYMVAGTEREGTSKTSYDCLNKLFAPSGIAALFSVALAATLGDVCSAKEGRATKFPFSSRQTPVALAEIFLPIVHAKWERRLETSNNRL